MRRHEAVGGGRFILGQLIGAAGTTYIAFDSVVPLYQKINRQEELEEKIGQLSSTPDEDIGNSQTQPTGELKALEDSIDQLSNDALEGVFEVTLLAGVTTIVGAKVALSGRNNS